jgi:hypothetical protein
MMPGARVHVHAQVQQLLEELLKRVRTELPVAGAGVCAAGLQQQRAAFQAAEQELLHARAAADWLLSSGRLFEGDRVAKQAARVNALFDFGTQLLGSRLHLCQAHAEWQARVELLQAMQAGDKAAPEAISGLKAAHAALDSAVAELEVSSIISLPAGSLLYVLRAAFGMIILERRTQRQLLKHAIPGTLLQALHVDAAASTAGSAAPAEAALAAMLRLQLRPWGARFAAADAIVSPAVGRVHRLMLQQALWFRATDSSQQGVLASGRAKPTTTTTSSSTTSSSSTDPDAQAAWRLLRAYRVIEQDWFVADVLMHLPDAATAPDAVGNTSACPDQVRGTCSGMCMLAAIPSCCSLLRGQQAVPRIDNMAPAVMLHATLPVTAWRPGWVRHGDVLWAAPPQVSLGQLANEYAECPARQRQLQLVVQAASQEAGLRAQLQQVTAQLGGSCLEFSGARVGDCFALLNLKAAAGAVGELDMQLRDMKVRPGPRGWEAAWACSCAPVAGLLLAEASCVHGVCMRHRNVWPCPSMSVHGLHMHLSASAWDGRPTPPAPVTCLQASAWLPGVQREHSQACALIQAALEAVQVGGHWAVC